MAKKSFLAPIKKWSKNQPWPRQWIIIPILKSSTDGIQDQNVLGPLRPLRLDFENRVKQKLAWVVVETIWQQHSLNLCLLDLALILKLLCINERNTLVERGKTCKGHAPMRFVLSSGKACFFNERLVLTASQYGSQNSVVKSLKYKHGHIIRYVYYLPPKKAVDKRLQLYLFSPSSDLFALLCSFKNK